MPSGSDPFERAGVPGVVGKPVERFGLSPRVLTRELCAGFRDVPTALGAVALLAARAGVAARAAFPAERARAGPTASTVTRSDAASSLIMR